MTHLSRMGLIAVLAFVPLHHLHRHTVYNQMLTLHSESESFIDLPLAQNALDA